MPTKTSLLSSPTPLCPSPLTNHNARTVPMDLHLYPESRPGRGLRLLRGQRTMMPTLHSLLRLWQSGGPMSTMIYLNCRIGCTTRSWHTLRMSLRVDEPLRGWCREETTMAGVAQDVRLLLSCRAERSRDIRRRIRRPFQSRPDPSAARLCHNSKIGRSALILRSESRGR